ncbi:hypothetical protein BKA56DRAFT_578813 [Ilyonectria sp. MPI-CAGE-AT-0026]|nr:hypothetical protein BKA56DRAFT_578813 [Ilyonectria sp. MPI-CAGE-AT-0026]
MTSSTAAAAAAAGRNGFGLHHPQPAHSPKPATPAPAPETAPSAHTEDSAHPHRTAAAGSLHRQHLSNPPASSSAPPTAPPTAPIASAPAPAAAPESQTANPTAPASTSASTSASAAASTSAPSTSAHPPPPSTPPPPFRSAVAAMAADHQAGASDAQPASTTADGPPSADHAMPDAPALDGFDATPRPAEPQPQATPVQQQLHLHHDTAMAAPDHFAPSTPFTPAAIPSLDQHAYMMMALASMSGAPSAMSPPPTVTPSQVTLPNPMDEAFHGLAPANAIRQTGADKALESFARVEFADSVFQMTTYAVIIGRDQRALEQARRDEKRADEHRRRVEDNANRGLPPPSPIAYERGKFSKSYVSEEGGMLGPESDNGENGRPAKRRKTSTQGSSQNENDEAQQAQENMISNRQYVSHTPGAAAVDLTSLRPSPWHVPFIGIHSPGPNIATKTKAISREHLKIAYNQEEGVFEAIPLHKNGFFCEDVHYKSEKVVLKCGDRLQIKDIDFRFLINGVERGCTGAEEDVEEITPTTKKRTHGGKEMSFDFESSHGNGEVRDTSDELSEVASPPELSDFGDGDADGDAEGDPEEDAEVDAEGDVDGDGEEEEIEEADVVETVEAELERPSLDPEGRVKHELMPQPHSLMPQMPKKRGPGRPPKNGIMSKREQRLLKKQQQEMAKKTLPQAPPVEPPIKRKVGRPRKHPLPENSSERPEKRKYKPRKPKNEDGAEGSDAERRAREKKEKKARPKSPPLELKIEDYTEEQVQKPNKNYGVLIDETLTAAGPDGLTLKQIYKRICQRYPWFYFHTETKGWESSVRHNLIGNEAFKKDETTNLWSRVPGVELDAGKKRKASSPDRGLAAAQAYGQYPYPYNAAQHIPPGAPGYHAPGQAPPVYQVPAYNAQQGQPGRPVQPYGASASPPGQPVLPVASQPPAPAQLPGYGPPPAPARPQLGAPQPGAYSSPYARPPPSATPPIKNEDGHAPAAVPPAQQPAAAPIAAKTVPGPVSISQHPVAAVAAVAPVAPVAAAPSRPAATPTPTTPARPVIEPRLLTAVVGLKNGLVENLKKARNPKAEAIVMSALNRCIGLKKEATENDKMETICMKGIRQVIDGFTKTKSPTPGAGPSSSDAPPIFEAKVLASLTGFKDVSIKALKAKLGESKAEAVTLSAIDRVLGLADASIVPPPAEGEPSVGNFEGVEQHLIKSIRQLLTGMNQKLQGVGA